jgi:hypothetical protein
MHYAQNSHKSENQIVDKKNAILRIECYAPMGKLEEVKL